MYPYRFARNSSAHVSFATHANVFRTRSCETAIKFQLTFLDWDKFASNDYIGDVSSDVKELLDSAMRRCGCMRLTRMGFHEGV